jgi:DNA-binding winged helix-turn-helix (wHTH) protein
VDLGFNTRNGSGAQWSGAASNVRGGTGDTTEASSRTAPARCVLFADFELDVQKQTLRKAGEVLKVPGKIYQAMLVLIESPGDLVTREQIRSRLWPREAHLNYDANVNTTVNKLRQVLGDTSEGSNFIQTVPRRGYSFIAPVRYADAPAVKPAEARSNGAATRDVFAAIGEALRSERARIWFTASVVTWVTAAILFAGMLWWHSHRTQNAVKGSAQIIDKAVTDRR